MDKSRKIVLNILIEYERNGTYTNLALKKHLRDVESSREKGFITALVYGVIEKKLYLDHYISAVSSVRLKKINKVVLNILRMGLYQLKFMSVPESAACNTSVELAKTNGQFKSAGFVNAILRNLSRDFDTVKLPKPNTVDYYSVKYSVSKQITEKLLNDFGTADFERFMESSCNIGCVYAAVNLKKTDADSLIIQLKAENIVAEKTQHNDLIKLSGAIDIEKSDSYHNGLFHIIGYPSYITAKAAVPTPKSVVLDMCASPGGKTFTIAYNSDNDSKIYAFDIHEHKVENLSRSCERLGITNVICKVSDSTAYVPELEESADVILCDVPCSGLGMIFKKPDIKYKDIDFDALICIQRDILENAAKYLKSGGRLVYSTCTVNADENSKLISTFLSVHNEFSIDSSYDICGSKGEKQFLPGTDYSDGFYVAVLLKK